MSSPIVIEGLEHFYGKGDLRKQILFGIDVEIRKGEIVILTGPSGSGKTTLLTLIGALRSAQHGRIDVLGHSLIGASQGALTKLRRRIGYIFQHHNLLDSLTLNQNVQMGLDLHPQYSKAEKESMATDALSAVGLGEQGRKDPNQVSGGQKQRAAIARALVSGPELILADEPTASLDRESGREVVDLMQSLSKEKGATVVLVTHDNRILDVADRIINLEDGRLVTMGEAVLSNTRKMVSLFSKSMGREDFTERIRAMPADEFRTLLEGTTSDAREFLKGMEIASNEAFESMLDRSLAVFSRKIESLLEAERVSLFLLDEDKGELWSKVARDGDDAPIEIRIPRDKGIAGLVASSGESVNIPDAYADERFNRSVDQESGFRTRSLLCIPLNDSNGRVLGVAQMINRQDGEPFTALDEARFKEFMTSMEVLVASWRQMKVPVAS